MAVTPDGKLTTRYVEPGPLRPWCRFKFFVLDISDYGLKRAWRRYRGVGKIIKRRAHDKRI